MKDTRNTKRLLTVLNSLVKCHKNSSDETLILIPATSGIPKLNLGDIKDTVKELTTLIKESE